MGNLVCCLSSLPLVSLSALLGRFPLSPTTYKLLSLELHALFGVSFATVAAISLVRAVVVWTEDQVSSG